MWVVDQQGKNTYDLSKMGMFSLEDKTEEMVKFHPAYHGKVSVINLYQNMHRTDTKKTIAVYADEEEAKTIYNELIHAMAEGCPVFDLSGFYSAKNQEIAEADAKGLPERAIDPE